MSTIIRNKNPEFYTTYYTKNFELYYRVNFRKYYHFDSINLVKPVGEFYTGSIYAPYKSLFITPIQIPGDTLVVSHNFSISCDGIDGDIDKYIEDNIDRFVQSSVWNGSDEKAINMYLKRIADKYNVSLETDCLNYTNAFYWQVDSSAGL